MAAARNPSRGESHYNAKLTAHDVRLIRQLIAERTDLLARARRLTNDELASKFEVHHRTIEKIADRRAWIHV